MDTSSPHYYFQLKDEHLSGRTKEQNSMDRNRFFKLIEKEGRE
jgi:hypothetical protein